MALTAEEQELFDFAVGSLPSWVRSQDELLTACAKMFGVARAQLKYLFGQALITQATGPTSTTPDWLAQHARDRGTSRQAAELDPVLQQRLRVIPDALTRQAILDAANAILAAAGVVGAAAMLELPRDGAWLGAYFPLTGSGGTFAQSGTVSRFTPTTLPWSVPPYRSPSVAPTQTWFLTISGAAAPANNGTRMITGMDNSAAVYTNASGVAGADPSVSWTARRADVNGAASDGFGDIGLGPLSFARAYAGRGYRMSSSRPLKILVILPFGTDAGTQASIEESLRTKKAAGRVVIVERRLVP